MTVSTNIIRLPCRIWPFWHHDKADVAGASMVWRGTGNTLGDVMILAIDPGLDGTGWALLEAGRDVVSCGVWKLPARYPWEKRLRMYTAYAASHAKCYKPYAVILEWPMFMQSSGGQTTARTGALVKLSMLVGAMYVRCAVHCDKMVLVTPQKWKGQLSKRVVIDRIRRIVDPDRLRKLSPGTHAWDAIGIGLHFNGRF